ncbi:MAG: radical SAM protein [Sedimentisphaerales bacterium]|nr:radical SAM protein [Sedimentisphaerales bacterium]
MSSFIFGPVPSRRLGRSLGIDMVPFKTCTYDCAYCQLGRTTNQTTQCKQWVPLDTLIEQLQSRLSTNPDYITLAGSGEPTLYTPLDQLITRIKNITAIPVAVLTNGSLLSRPEIRQALAQADLVIPSLDAGNDRTFQIINRPCPEITFADMLQGLIDFRSEFTNQYWLEVFIIQNLNTSESEIQDLASCIGQIKPDRVQVNTVTRPPADAETLPVPQDQLEQIARKLSNNAQVIADYKNVHDQSIFTAQRDDVLNMIARRPCSIEDIAQGLNLHRNEVLKYIEELSTQGKIKSQLQNNRLYYTAATPN